MNDGSGIVVDKLGSLKPHKPLIKIAYIFYTQSASISAEIKVQKLLCIARDPTVYLSRVDLYCTYSITRDLEF